ncbi:metal-sulfur cluster assembly factor [Pleomorphomonas sp. JP5]|uniref:metal-sulfur cluster assembly factor n=1 Tax=Pleomorphomonas sp. JP5 TaxID=2942998 RepID=UPI00204422A1|nr:metal-sulfur cluster assembly factor [Pleomorphomonas sp. JP5]MCM5556148.1 metal-sulfur cluster assembly factor [Pleomorphomonas sp. JP5]
MKSEILAALATVDDPELGIDIVSLGLVRRLEFGEGAIKIELMMTTPTCPLGGLIGEHARAAVERAVGTGWTVNVTIDKAAVWSTELADPAVRSRFERQPSRFEAAVSKFAAGLFGR